MYTVYMHRNKENGKRYIGITSVEPKVRWKKGYGYSEALPIGRAFRKYGWDGFTHEVLFTELTEDEAKRIEIELIAKYHTQDDAFGYNICAGGNGVTGWHPTEETRQKISEAAKKRTGDKNPNFGNRWTDEMKKAAGVKKRRENLSEETLRRMSLAAQGRTGENNSFYGHTHSEETRQKIAEIRYRAVNMLDKEGKLLKTFRSLKDAAIETGINASSISNCCRKKAKTAGGFVWHYAADDDDGL